MADIWKVADYPEDNIPIMKHISINDVKKELFDKDNIVATTKSGKIYLLREDYRSHTKEYIYEFCSIGQSEVIGLDILKNNESIFIFDNEEDLFRWALDQKEG